MFCGKCGAKLRDDAQFCQKCGTPFTKKGSCSPKSPSRETAVRTGKPSGTADGLSAGAIPGLSAAAETVLSARHTPLS